MSAKDRGWTITPTLVWFIVILIAGIRVFDGNVNALADRLTKKRAPEAAAPGPVIVAKNDSSLAPAEDAELVATLPAPPAGSHDIGALDDVCLVGTEDHCTKWAMDGFYKALADARKGTLGRALRVSWYGDSVVATDALPGRLRTRLQAELGDGGPGFVYVLPPHRFCAHERIVRTGGENFLQFAVSTQHAADGFYGPAGASVETGGGSVTIKSSAKVTNAELYYLAQPDGGTASIIADGTETSSASTAADTKAAGWLTLTTAGASKFEIKGRGKVRMFGVSLENTKGAVVDNLGIVSVHVKSYAAADADHWAAELGHRGSDLIMFMIGANEAEWLHPGDRALKEYQSHYENLLAPIRKGRPDASCLVVSPTDQAEADGDGFKSRPVMPLLVDAQRKAAHAQGCAFYSTYDWMGGKGSAAKWFKKKLVNSDFQHLSVAGANKMADGLYGALMAGAKHAGN